MNVQSKCFVLETKMLSSSQAQMESVSNEKLNQRDLAKKRRRRGKFERMRDQHKSLLEENGIVKKKIEEIEKQLELTKISQQKELKQINDDANAAEIQDLKDQVFSLKDLVSDYEVKNQDLNNSLKLEEEKMEEKNTQLQLVEDEKGRLQTDVKKSKEDYEDIKEEVRFHWLFVKDEEELEQYNTDLRELVNKLEEEKRKLNNNLYLEKEKLESKIKELQNVDCDIKRLSSEIENYEARNKILKTNYEDLLKKLGDEEKLKDSNDELQAQIIRLKEEKLKMKTFTPSTPKSFKTINRSLSPRTPLRHLSRTPLSPNSANKSKLDSPRWRY